MLTTNRMLEYLGVPSYHFLWGIVSMEVASGSEGDLPSYEKEGLQGELKKRCLEKMIHEALLKQRTEMVLQESYWQTRIFVVEYCYANNKSDA